MTAKKGVYDFDNYKKDELTKPRDKAWGNWKKFEKVGDKVQGFIRDAFYRPEEGLFKAQRGITLEQPDGVLVNVGVKRIDFVMKDTDDLRIGDPLTVELIEIKPSTTKGFSGTKIFGYYGVNLPENKDNPTVKELDNQDEAIGGSSAPVEEKSNGEEAKPEDIPFP